MIVQQGSINTTALVVPDAYVQLVPPSVLLINGVPSNVLGIVGSAAWGPLNTPTPFSTYADYQRQFGALQPRKYDMGTQAAVAILQGANNMLGVRVTDGTDVAAAITVQTNCLTATSKYTGSGANADTISIAPGSAASTFKATIARPGLVPEVFDNLAAGANGNGVWLAIANAINNGVSGVRGPSALIVASAGAGATAPATATYTLTGGVDGAATITSTILLGADGTARTGMYALRGSGASIALLADCDTQTSWATQVAYGLSEGTYMQLVGPASETVAAAVTQKTATTPVDTYAAKVILGDWVYFNDTVNSQPMRLVSPQGVFAGRLANLSPEQSGLNKQVYGIVGTQRSVSGVPYSAAELQSLGQAGIDVICTPVPGGKYFGIRFGRNASSNAVIHGDNYTRLTNYIASTLNSAIGAFIGMLQSATTRREAQAAISSYLDGLWSQGMIGNAQGTIPYSVQLNDQDNPPNRVALGYMQSDVKVQYLSVIENFIVNVEGGQSVVIASGAPTQA